LLPTGNKVQEKIINLKALGLIGRTKCSWRGILGK